MKGKTRMEKGITLVALIITIVVLLILAVVAINSIQNDGILGQAENSAGVYNNSVEIGTVEIGTVLFSKFQEIKLILNNFIAIL